MKAFRSLILKTSALLLVGMMAGCGGGSDGGGGGAPPAGGLTPEKANIQLTALATELGCNYTTVAVAEDTKTAMALAFRATELLNGAMTESSIASNLSAPEIASSQPGTGGGIPAIAAVEPGTCGGSVTMPDFGFGTYTFDNFCYSDPDTGATATINGSLVLETDGSAITFSTPAPLRIITANPAGDVTINIGGGALGLDGSGNINSLSIASLDVTDNSTGTSYSATNINVAISGSTVAFSATVNDPGVGTLYVEGTANTDTRQANINVSDTGGSVVSVSGIGGVYDATFDGSPIGTLDCSMIAVPSLPI